MTRDSDHPDLDSLCRYREGGLREHERGDIARHLQTCARCQGVLEALASAAPGPEFAVPPVSEFMAKLAEVQRELLREGASGDALKRRVEAELTPYLGVAAANRILQQVAPSGENLLSTVDFVMRLFLGKAAAGRLVSRIVDRAIMRT
jgi:hypothetical protein